MAVDAPNNDDLGSVLQELWMTNRDLFRDDVITTLAAAISRETGVPAACVRDLVKLALSPSFSGMDDWHPALVVLHRWDVEPMLQHALQLFLTVNKADEIQVRGRVARKNQPGSYSLLLSWPDIADGLGNS